MIGPFLLSFYNLLGFISLNSHYVQSPENLRNQHDIPVNLKSNFQALSVIVQRFATRCASSTQREENIKIYWFIFWKRERTNSSQRPLIKWNRWSFFFFLLASFIIAERGNYFKWSGWVFGKFIWFAGQDNSRNMQQSTRLVVSSHFLD